MNRRGFLQAAAALPAAPILRVLPVLAVTVPTAGAVMTATEVLFRRAEFLREWSDKIVNPPMIIDPSGSVHQMLMDMNIPKDWLKP